MEELISTLPEHKQQLEKAKSMVNKIDKEFKVYYNAERDKIKTIVGDKFNETKWAETAYIPMPEDERKRMFKSLTKILDVVGDLSASRFNIRSKLEEFYDIKYSKNPMLGKTLFQETYTKIHKPYDKIKNRCFNIIEKLTRESNVLP